MATPIPVRCAHRPTLGGLVVPYISITHSGGHVLGGVHTSKRDRCIREHLCQVCGQPLTIPWMLIVRQADIDAGYTPEPAMHPECGRYSAAACPMVAGRMDHWRTSPLPTTGKPCDKPGCNCAGWVEDPRQAGQRRRDAPTGPWHMWWCDGGYDLAVNPEGRLLGIALSTLTPRRIRPVEVT